MTDQELYERREQTGVKHLILRQYLERFTQIVGSRWDSITYVDGFAGPWNAKSRDLKDSSFSIALEELRKARASHAQRGRNIHLRCFFLEQNREAYVQLKQFADQVSDAEVAVQNCRFEDSIDDIRKFVQMGQNTFPFIFIDPTGWTGFALKTIAPLLRLDPGEVLINFMTGHIRRFLREEHSEQSFVELFGSTDFKRRTAGRSGVDLEDSAIGEYMNRIKEAGGFNYVLPAIVLHPAIDRTHFHLIYATRHPKGVEVFKGAEKRAMEEMERLRAGAQRRRREERTLQVELLFQAETAPQSRYYQDLRERYLGRAQQELQRLLEARGRVPYNVAWEIALRSPLVWESDLKSWIQDWQEQKVLRIDGLQGRERVPNRDRAHFLVWVANR
jgi:three-Cys-motif partner protein